MKKLELVGQKFGRLTVVIEAGLNKRQRSLWFCECNCGEYLIVVGQDLKNGRIQSCGCLQRQQLRKQLTTHGKSLTPEYRVWTNMKDRC